MKTCEIDGCYKDAIRCVYIPCQDTSYLMTSYLCSDHAKKLGYCPKCGNFGKDCCKESENMKTLNTSNTNSIDHFLYYIGSKIIHSLKDIEEKDISELTIERVLAIAIMSGCELEFETVSPENGQYELIIKTKNKITITKNDNRFVVVESKC